MKKRKKTKTDLEEPEARPPEQKIKAVWPDEAPILTAEDLCRQYTKKKRRDLSAWLELSFPGDFPNRPEAAMLDSLYEVIHEATGEKLAAWEFCLDERFPFDQVAGVWNEALRRLGYELPESEAWRSRKRKKKHQR